MSSDNITHFQQLLKANGHHITQSRIKVFELIDRNHPQSIREILVLSNGLIDRVSLYRNIDLFERLGIVQRVYIGWKYKIELTEHFVAHHHHLSCTKCGRVIDIEDENDIRTFIDKVVSKYNFTPLKHQFEIEGICKSCRS